MIVATAGTTNAGMIDPLGPCAQIARDAGLWNHVDGPWGGALIASDRLRGALAGIEQADCITIDAHKWLATTMGCGGYARGTRHRPRLPDARRGVRGGHPRTRKSTQRPGLTPLLLSFRARSALDLRSPPDEQHGY
jgi:hypothetical protein